MKIYDAHAHLMLDLVGAPWYHGRPQLKRGEELYGISKYYISTIDGPALYPDPDCLRRCNDLTYDFMKEQRHDALCLILFYAPECRKDLTEKDIDLLKRSSMVKETIEMCGDETV